MFYSDGQFRDLVSNKREVLDDPEWGFDLPWPDFIRGVFLLGGCSFGSRIQNRFCAEHDFVKISAKIDQGDFRRYGTKKYIEFKSSIPYHDKSLWNLVQVRDWQKVDYIFTVFDMRSGYDPNAFLLTHNQLLRERDCVRFSSAHGTAKATANNTTNEKRSSLIIGSPDYRRWMANYHSEYFTDSLRY